jgi:FkbM family methyltransferase
MALRNFVRQTYSAIPFKRQMFQIVRGRVPLPQRLYQHLHFRGPFDVDVAPDRRFHMFSSGHQIENDLFWAGYGGGWEGCSLRVWQALCRDRNGLIFDIGSNTGIYALAAATLAPEAEVVAFEPVARVADQLERNVALNGFPILVERKAVSDRSGRLPIYDNLATHNYSASLEGQGPDAASYEVDVVTLDDWLSERTSKAVIAIKIDVERHEPAVLRGMKHLLATQHPPMLIEILDEPIGEMVERLINGLGYEFFQIREAGGLALAGRLAPPRGSDRNHLLCTAEDFERSGLDRLLTE